MLGFLKSRTTAEAQGAHFADHAVSFWVMPNAKDEEKKSTLIELGCSDERTPIELIALQVFAEFYGMTAALSHKLLPKDLYPRMTESFLARVIFLTRGEALPVSVTVTYDTLEQLLAARVQHYGTFLSTTTVSEVPRMAVDYFCDFAHDGDHTSLLKSNLRSIFDEGSSYVFTTISKARLR